MSEDVPPRDRRARHRGPRLGSALLGGGLLIALGFGLGVVAGLVLEEPDLILDYAAGRTQDVPLGTGAGPRSLGTSATAPDVAARPPPDRDAKRPATSPGVIGEASSDSAPVADLAAPAPSPSGGFVVQVGAFSEASAAERLASRLREGGLPVYVAPSVDGDAQRWRVRVGPMASRDEAEQLARRLEREQQLSTWVLTESSL